MQNGHGRESRGCVEVGFSKENCSVQYPGEQMSSGGRLSWNPLKVLLYDNLVGVVSHVTKMTVTPLDSPWPKPPVVCKLHGSVFYTSEVIADQSFSLREYGISPIYFEKRSKILNISFVPPN